MKEREGLRTLFVSFYFDWSARFVRIDLTTAERDHFDTQFNSGDLSNFTFIIVILWRYRLQKPLLTATFIYIYCRCFYVWKVNKTEKIDVMTQGKT